MPSSYSIGEHYEAFVRRQVESGRYASASEVMRDSLRLLEEQEQLCQLRLEALRKEIEIGDQSGDAGPWDVEEFLREARRRLSERNSDAA